MKRFILFFFLFLVACFFYFGCSQIGEIVLIPGANPIHLSTKYENYINLEDLNFKVNSMYAFISEDGKDYAVIVRNANEFMADVEKHFKVKANAITQPKYFTVNNAEISKSIIEIYCISDDSWPDAPPRIIIVSQ